MLKLSVDRSAYQNDGTMYMGLASRGMVRDEVHHPIKELCALRYRVTSLCPNICSFAYTVAEASLRRSHQSETRAELRAQQVAKPGSPIRAIRLARYMADEFGYIRDVFCGIEVMVEYA